jgi:hypothetical protein
MNGSYKHASISYWRKADEGAAVAVDTLPHLGAEPEPLVTTILAARTYTSAPYGV